MDLNIIMCKNNIDIINSKYNLINSFISWEPNYHFKWNIKYINIYIYSPESSDITKVNRELSKKVSPLGDTGKIIDQLKIYNPNNELKVLSLLENNKLKIIKINKKNNPLWLINKKNNIIKLRIINIRTAISNSRILLNILNKKILGIMKYLEILKIQPAIASSTGALDLSCNDNRLARMMVSSINDKLYNNWYDLINIKKINTIMTGIKLEIHGRLNKRKKASRTRKYIFLKGSVKNNSKISLIDRSSVRMKVINGSAGINIYISNRINVLK